MNKPLKFGLIFLGTYIAICLIGAAGIFILPATGFLFLFIVILVNFLDFLVLPALLHCHMAEFGGCQTFNSNGFISLIFYFLLGLLVGYIIDKKNKK